MPEPRETHAAIDARRNAPRGGDGVPGRARLDLTSLLRDYTTMNAAQCTVLADAVMQHWLPGVLAERDALAATVRLVGEWAMVNEIDEPPLDWRGLGDILRAAPSDPAPDTGGEAT